MMALSTIGHLVAERQARRNEVLQDIARSSSGEQQLAGPILVIPYEKTVRQWHENDRGERHLEEREISGQLHLLPEDFLLDGDIRTELRARGIYEARLYHAKLRVKADFAVPLHYGVGADIGTYRFGQPFIAMGVTDIRGIEGPLAATLEGVPVELLPGTGTRLLSEGLHLTVPGVGPESAARLQLAVDLPLLGTSEFHVIPVGRDTRVHLKSNWLHPSFSGDFLPVQRKLDANGFTAQWATTFFSTNLEETLRRCEEQVSCSDFTSHRLGVSFVDPVDQYLKTDRAIKYALLFITLTFAGFFLFDVLRKLPVHPVQYGLVGAALALFYLLLLSLSEHVGFAVAYLLSAAGCVGLIAFYVSHVLHSLMRGLGFAAGLAGLYGCLYGLLSADDYALLMGSLLLFAVLAAVMVLTRHVDWSTLGTGPATSFSQGAK
jgi:inner membrane protein